jgi:hypothetical protein
MHRLHTTRTSSDVLKHLYLWNLYSYTQGDYIALSGNRDSASILTYFETSATVYQSNWHSISQDSKLQQHPYENHTGLIFCTAGPWRWKHSDFSKHWQQFSFHGLSPHEIWDLQQDYCENLEGLLSGLLVSEAEDTTVLRKVDDSIPVDTA